MRLTPASKSKETSAFLNLPKEGKEQQEEGLEDIVELDEDKHEDEDDGEWKEGEEDEGEDKWHTNGFQQQ